jgi:hypothetical protein
LPEAHAPAHFPVGVQPRATAQPRNPAVREPPSAPETTERSISWNARYKMSISWNARYKMSISWNARYKMSISWNARYKMRT